MRKRKNEKPDLKQEPKDIPTTQKIGEEYEADDRRTDLLLLRKNTK